MIEKLKYDKLIIVNSWFRYPVYSRTGRRLSGALLAAKGVENDLKFLWQVQKETNGAVKFYYLK